MDTYTYIMYEFIYIYISLLVFFDRILTNYVKDITDRHNRKLFNLYGGQIFKKVDKRPCFEFN